MLLSIRPVYSSTSVGLRAFCCPRTVFDLCSHPARPSHGEAMRPRFLLLRLSLMAIIARSNGEVVGTHLGHSTTQNLLTLAGLRL